LEQRSRGQYRTQPARGHSPMVYVRGAGVPSYVTEAVYRAGGHEPAFEQLPTEDEYDAKCANEMTIPPAIWK